MKLVLTLLVRDEQDIVEANLLHHFTHGVDFVIATNNNSVDGTRAILETFEQQGRLRIIDEPADDYAQSDWVTRMARLAATEYGADWVINTDVDEFWWPKRGNLKDALSLVPDDYGAVTVPRVNFIPTSAEDAPFFQRMIIRDTTSVNIANDPLPPKVAHRAVPDVVVAQGNHAVSGNGLEVAPTLSPIVILHFPLRSYAQFENKIIKGGQAYERNTTLDRSVGAGWRLLYDRYLAGTLRSHYLSELLSDDTVDRRLAEGTLIVDRRLCVEMTELTAAETTSGADARDGGIRVVPARPIQLRSPAPPPARPAPSTPLRRVARRARRALRARYPRPS